MNKNIDFNKVFFVNPEDQVYKNALMFTKYGLIGKEVLEYMFFAHEDAIGNINYLEHLEQHNENFEYMNKWLEELSNIETPSDWSFHHSRLSTRMKKMSYIKEEDSYLNKFQNEKSVFYAIKNTLVLWNNLVNSIQNMKSVNKDKERIDLWLKLKNINNENYDDIKFEQKDLVLFDKIMKIREKDEFINNQKLIRKEDAEMINEMKKKILKIYNKNNLENTLIDKIKQKVTKMKL